MKCLYKYPQAEFPYQRLLDVNRSRTRKEPEFELIDTGVFDQDRYFDIFTEYAKADPNDILIRITVTNRGPEPAPLHLLPTLWFRNTWSWGPASTASPTLAASGDGIGIEYRTRALGPYQFTLATGNPQLLFTENETNAHALWDLGRSRQPYVERRLSSLRDPGRDDAVNPGADAAPRHAPGISSISRPARLRLIRLRLTASTEAVATGSRYRRLFAERICEADEFYSFAPATLSEDAKSVQRQAFAGLLWSKQYYHFVVDDWLKGDPGQPPPPPAACTGAIRSGCTCTTKT